MSNSFVMSVDIGWTKYCTHWSTGQLTGHEFSKLTNKTALKALSIRKNISFHCFYMVWIRKPFYICFPCFGDPLGNEVGAPDPFNGLEVLCIWVYPWYHECNRGMGQILEGDFMVGSGHKSLFWGGIHRDLLWILLFPNWDMWSFPRGLEVIWFI